MKINSKENFEEKILMLGTFGCYLYGASFIVKRNILNIGMGLMILASLFFIKKIDLKKLDKLQKLFLILIALIPIWDLFSDGGIESALISIQKSYRFLPLFLVPIFLNTTDKIKKFFYCINFATFLTCLNVLNIYRKINWNFGTGFEYIKQGFNISHSMEMISYLILASLFFAYKEKDKIMLSISSFVYVLTLSMIFISQRRGAWLALILSMGLFILVKMNKKVFLSLIVLGSIVLSVGYINREKLKDNRYYKRFESIRDTKNSSPRIRLMLWQASYDIFKENWLFGVGKDNSPKYYLEYFENNKKYVEKHLKTNSAKESLVNISKAGNPHSMYFDNLINMGLLFFYWLGMMFYIFFEQLKNTIILKKNKETRKFSNISLCCLCVTISYLVIGAFESAWGSFFERHLFLAGLIIFIILNKNLEKINN